MTDSNRIRVRFDPSPVIHDRRTLYEFKPTFPTVVSDEMIELREHIQRTIMRSLGIPRLIVSRPLYERLGFCRGHSHVKGLHPSLVPNFYCMPEDIVLVDGFKREHVLFGKTGANGYAVQLQCHAGKFVYDWKRHGFKRQLIQGVVIHIKRQP